ncbi:hypothetical protein [Deinococcus frigens]|uniref:hypothetical protein n=1 Tax=Deinococcus frigens TaxID=249403 RepID=UPI0012EBAAED|nr:hypothetical protein [Deinococcus frigens]
MTPEELRVSRALDSLWQKFQLSPLAQSEQIQARGLVDVKGASSWTGSFEEGAIYASSYIELTSSDSSLFSWNLFFTYEQEPNQVGKFLHLGMAYSDAGILVGVEGTQLYKPSYNIGDTDLVTERSETIQLTDLGIFSQAVADLADTCLEDLAYAYQNNLFSKIAALALEREQPLASNPFKE